MTGMQQDRVRLVVEFWNGTVQTIRRAPELAERWKGWADNRDGPNVQTLAAYCTDGATSMISTIDKINAKAQQAPYTGHLTAIVSLLTDGQYTLTQVRNVMANMRSACVGLRDADKSSFAAISSALDTFAAAVPSIPEEAGSLTLYD